jgi:molybdopterin-guanine dinucleotide biosynthesis protein B
LKKTKVLLIVGRKKSGKTTLIEKLISGLKSRGYRVGSLKHTAHGHVLDREGTDSFRHARAGAETTLIISPGRMAIFSESLENRDLADVLDFLFADCDLTIGEGFKRSGFPKIEILETGKYDSPISGPDDNLLAVVSEKDPGLTVPHFGIDQVDSIIEFIEARFLKEPEGRRSA